MNNVNAHVVNHSVHDPRIIKGIYRMRSIPVIKPARPPLARIRKVIFDTLDNFHDINVVCDVCCGSGSLGLEALSRGASDVVFMDKSPRVIQNLNQVIKEWGIPFESDAVTVKKINKYKETETELKTETPKKNDAYATTYVCDVTRIKLKDKIFDTIFLDLPFPLKQEETVLKNLIDNNLVDENSLIVVRTLPDDIYNHEGFELIKEKKVGISKLAFFKITNPINDEIL